MKRFSKSQSSADDLVVATSTLSLLDRKAAEAMCRELWGERQDDCAKYGADIPMPTVEVRVDELANLLREKTQRSGIYESAVRGRADFRAAYRQSLEAQKLSGWQSIQDAPTDGSRVDLWEDGQRYPDHFWVPKHSCWACTERRRIGKHRYDATVLQIDFKPSHWMLPPEPPK